MKRLLVALLVFASVFAADITATINPSKATLEFGEGQRFNMTVRNRDELDMANLKLSITGIPTWLRAYPNKLSVGSGDEKQIAFYFSNQAVPDTYIYELELQDADTRQIVWEGSLVITVSGEVEENGEEGDTRFLHITTDKRTSPGETLIVNLKTSQDIVPVDGKIVLLKDEKEVTEITASLDSINKNFTISVPETEESGVYILRAFLPGRGISNETFVTVGEVSKVEVTTELQTKLLGKEVEFVAKNLGNVFEEDYLTTKISIFDRPLLEASPTPEITKEGLDYILRWRYRISPGEEKLIASYSIDYAPYSIIGVLLIIAIILILQKPEAVEIKKEMEKFPGKDETRFKVKLDVVNSSDEVVEDVVVEDFIPEIAKVTKAFIKKPEAKKAKGGTRLIWELKKLQPGEERVFSYEAVLGFGIVGKLDLPKPKVEWKQ